MRASSGLRYERLLLLLALLAGAALRLYRLGAESLWYDEAVSVYLAQKSVPALIAHTARDIHPPGYYLLLHLWGLATQPALHHGLEFLYAWVSLACGVLTLALLYPLGRRLAGAPAALVGVWLAALHPFAVWYSQEVRMYALGGLLGLLCLYATLRWLESGGTLWLAVYAGSAAAGLYALYYFAFVLAGIGAAALLMGARRRLAAWAASHLLVLLLYLPWLGTFWRQATDPPVPPWRAPWADAGEVWGAVQEGLAAFAIGQTPVGPLWLWAVITVAATAIALGLAPARRRMAALLLYTFMPFFLLAAMTLGVTPLYHVRYLYPAAAAFPLVAGAALVEIGRRARGAAAPPLLALILAYGLSLRAFWTDPAYRADDHRGAVAALATGWRPGDVILVNAGWVYPLLEVYWPQAAVSEAIPPPLGEPVRLGALPGAPGAEEVPVVRGGSVDGDPGLGWGDPQSDFFAISSADTVRGLEALAARYARLWHYRLYDTVSDPAGVVRAWLDANTALRRDEAIAGRDFGRLELRDLRHPPVVAPIPPADFGDALRLVGADVPPYAERGSLLYVTLLWEALPGLEALPVGLSSSLRLYDSGGAQVAQADAGPAPPTTAWQAGQRVRDPLAVGVPAGLAPGAYAVELIVYRQDDAAPLPIDDARAWDGQRLRLGSVQVED